MSTAGAGALPFSAAADRNKGPILLVLAGVLPAAARVLEVASGTGQHAAHFAAERLHWDWQPSDGDEAALAAIAAHSEGLRNVRAPIRLDVLEIPWPVPEAAFDAVYNANLLHISPGTTGAALMRGAQQHLRPGGVLVIYGPFVVDGEATAASNLAFDADLRARNAQWGLRRLADVVDTAAHHGLQFERRFAMPANNLLLVLRKPR